MKESIPRIQRLVTAAKFGRFVSINHLEYLSWVFSIGVLLCSCSLLICKQDRFVFRWLLADVYICDEKLVGEEVWSVGVELVATHHLIRHHPTVDPHCNMYKTLSYILILTKRDSIQQKDLNIKRVRISSQITNNRFDPTERSQY
jgi:hypothetical protein